MEKSGKLTGEVHIEWYSSSTAKVNNMTVSHLKDKCFETQVVVVVFVAFKNKEKRKKFSVGKGETLNEIIE